MKALTVLVVAMLLVLPALPASAQSARATKGGADVGSSSSQMFAADGSRKGAIIMNAGNGRIWCAFGETAAVDQGFFLDQAGVLNMTGDLRSIQALNCLVGSGTQRLTWELFR